MPKEAQGEKQPFFKNKWNIVLSLVTVALLCYVAYSWIVRGVKPLQKIERGIERITEGCEKPPDSEVEAHFRDKAGSIPVAPDFDADPEEICGNGIKFFCTSKPPKKAIPSSWSPPPKPGTDPSYQGPEPGAPFKESPYAMPSSKAVLARGMTMDLRDPKFVSEMKAEIARASGKVGWLGKTEIDSRFAEFGPHLVHIDEKTINGDDDEVVARKLMENGIDFVLVDRKYPPVLPWIEEKMSTVRLRLRDAVSLGWFHPVVLGSGYALFRLAPPFEIPKHIKRRITSRIRTILAGGEEDGFEYDPPIASVGDDEFRVIVSLRWRAERGLKGRKLTKKMAHGKSLLQAIERAASKIKGDWNEIRGSAVRDRTTSVAAVPQSISEAISHMEIEVEVLHDMCSLTDRALQNMLWYLELGLEGLSLRGNGRFHYLEPAYAVHMEVSSEVVFLEKLLIKNGLKQFLRDPKNKKLKRRGRTKVVHESIWRKDTKYRFGRFRAVHWIERQSGGDIVELYRGVPLKTIWDVNRASLVRSLKFGADWLVNNQTSDGQYAYKYTPTNKPGRRWTPGGNIVRHALNPYTLLMVNKIEPDPKYVESAKRGIEFTLKFIRHKGTRCVICHRDPPARYYNAKLGTVAVTILSILKLGDVADISEYDDVLRCLGEALLYNQDPNGHFWQYDVPEDHPYYGAESTIAPGEFVFALARLYNHYKDEKYKEAIDRALPFYMKAWRKLLGERTKEGIYDEEHRVNLIGIVPWLVTAMNDLHMNTSDPRYAEIAFEQQDWIDKEFFWYLNRAQYPDYVGAAFKVHRELPAINSCQYTEGAAAAYDLAKRVGKNEEIRRQVVVHGMRFCLQLQYDGYDSMFFLPVPEEAMGGYRYTLGHLRLRNDYNYHAMAAIAQAVEYLEPDDYPAERPLRISPVMRELLGGLPNPPQDVPRRSRGEELPEGGEVTGDGGTTP